jgi:hypothetical protein
MKVDYKLKFGKLRKKCPYGLRHKVSETILVGGPLCFQCIYNQGFGKNFVDCSYNLKKGE